MKELLGLTKRDTRLMIWLVSEARATKLKDKAEEPGKFVRFCRLIESVEDDGGDYARHVNAVIERYTNEAATMVSPSDVAAVNVKLNTEVKRLDEEEGSEASELVLEEDEFEYLKGLWDLPNPLLTSAARDLRSAVVRINDAIQNARKVDRKRLAVVS